MVNTEKNASKSVNVKTMANAILKQESAIASQVGLERFVPIGVPKDFMERSASNHASASMALNATTRLERVNAKLVIEVTNASIDVKRTTTA